ncbi:hypothetical protein C2G38_2165755 [Gigaspora rosea]|uniref:Uncharacterized protein n=1 Tax=Gigaspora rosea TaxID=44941 RepID=A0A397VW12_9GLOM|nr:hypothetical protein C2G38_2165755 [Gigaspora rosea]
MYIELDEKCINSDPQKRHAYHDNEIKKQLLVAGKLKKYKLLDLDLKNKRL